jgi:CDP-diacylglycerol---glycerol-3-phosphate 3-phosphatidyltransferase
MISVYNIKPKFQQLLMPVLRRLHRIGITANMITLAAIGLSVLTGALVAFWDNRLVLVLVPAALFVRMALNALDGMMARQYQMQSRLGEVLNEVGDIVSDVCIFSPFWVLLPTQPWMLFTFILLAVLNEFAGLLGKAMGGERRYDGPMGKSDRALLWGLGCLVLYFFPSAIEWANTVLGGAIGLILLSTYTRLRKAIQHGNL